MTEHDSVTEEQLLSHMRFVQSIARALTQEPNRADDIAQDAMILALEKPPRDALSIRAWFRTVVTNLVRSSERRELRLRRREEQSALQREGPSSEEHFEREALVSDMMKAIESLSPANRSVLILRYYDGLSPKEIARRSGITLEATKGRLKRGLSQLRRALEDRRGDSEHLSLGLLSLGNASLLPMVQSTGIALLTRSIQGIINVTLKTKSITLVVGVTLITGVYLVQTERVGDKLQEIEAESLLTDLEAERTERIASKPSIEIDDEAALERVAIVNESAIRGVVRNSIGTPIVGAFITCYREDVSKTIDLEDTDELELATTETDSEGRFTVEPSMASRDLPKSPAQQFELFVKAQGWSSQSLRGAKAGDEIEIVLHDARRLEGFVRDLEGNPVPHARVAWKWICSATEVTLSGESGTDGSYRIDGLPGEESIPRDSTLQYYHVEADGFADHYLACQRFPGESIDGVYTQDLYVTRGSTIEGRVIDVETGRSISGASVHLYSNEGNYGLRRGGLKNPFSPRVTDELRSDEEGRFSFGLVPAWGIQKTCLQTASPGKALLGGVVAFAEGYASSSVDVYLADENDVTSLEINLYPAASVQGRVILPDGTPVQDVEIWANTRQTPRLSDGFIGALPPQYAVSDVEGFFRIDAIASTRNSVSPVSLNVKPPGLQSLEVVREVTPGGVTEVEIVLAPVNTARIHVTDRFGEGVAGAKVKVIGESEEHHTDENGTVVLAFESVVYSGLIQRVCVKASGLASGVSESFLPSWEDPPVIELELGPSHPLAGIIVYEDGSPARVRFTVGNGNLPIEDVLGRSVRQKYGGPWLWYAYATSHEDGTFFVEDLPLGPYHILCSSQWIRDIATGDADIEIVLPMSEFESESSQEGKTGSIELFVTDEETGDPIMFLRETHLDLDDHVTRPMRVEAGHFVFENIPVGRWKMRIADSGFQPLIESVQVEEGHILRLDRVLNRGAMCRGRIRTKSGIKLTKMQLTLEGRDGASTRSCDVSNGGSFEMSGLLGGASYTPLVVGRSQGKEKSWWVTEKNDPIVVALDEVSGSVIEVVPAGFVSVEILYAKLPDIGESKTQEQERLSRDSFLTVRDRLGSTMKTLHRIHRSQNSFILPYGDYTVELHVPNLPQMTKRVSLSSSKPGADTLVFAPR